MGERNSRLTLDATETAEWLVDALGSLGRVTARKMFGGYGVFADEVMFALVDSAGTPHLRVDDTTISAFRQAGATKHSRMPYWSIPASVVEDPVRLVAWAAEAWRVAGAARK